MLQAILCSHVGLVASGPSGLTEIRRTGSGLRPFATPIPESVFDDILEIANLVAGAEAIEVGAGTGIATEPLVDRGLVVTAIEPAAEMAGVAETKLGDRAQIFVGRFETSATTVR